MGARLGPRDGNAAGAATGRRSPYSMIRMRDVKRERVKQTGNIRGTVKSGSARDARLGPRDGSAAGAAAGRRSPYDMLYYEEVKQS